MHTVNIQISPNISCLSFPRIHNYNIMQTEMPYQTVDVLGGLRYSHFHNNAII